MPGNPPSLIKHLKFISSEPFEIIAQSGKRFFVHSDVLAKQSEAHRSNTSGWNNTPKRIDLTNWDDDTVERFVQFLYVGDYQVPDSGLEEAEGVEGVGGQEIESRDGVNTPDTAQSLVGYAGLGTTEINILLVHAKVYTLAQYQDVEALETMAYERLRATLGGINSDTLKEVPNTIPNIVELLEYVYSNTNLHTEAYTEPHINPYTIPKEPMEDLVSTFAANNLEELVGRRDMAISLRKRCNLAVQIVERVAERFCKVEKAFGAWHILGDLEREVQDWKNRATTSDEKVRQLEVSSAETIRQSKAANADIVQQLEVAYAVKIMELQTAKTEKVQLEVSNAAEIQRMKSHTQILEERLQQLETVNTEKCQLQEELQGLSTEIYRFERNIRQSESELQWLEGNQKWFEANCPESANVRKVQCLEAGLEWLEEGLGWFQVKCPEKVREFESTHEAGTRRFKENARKAQEAGIPDVVKIKILEAMVEWFESKVEWLRAACPENVQQWREDCRYSYSPRALVDKIS